MLRSIRYAFDDLLRTYLPLKSKVPYAFAFLIHLRSIDDVYRKFPFFKVLPTSWTEWLLAHGWPITVSRITGLTSAVSGQPIPGWVISVPLVAKHMMENRELARRKIAQGIRLAERKGARIVGLGALTASLTRGGHDLVDGTSVAITTGHAYTIYNVTQTLLSIMDELGDRPENAVLAIVGASGSIGSGSARLLSRHPFKRILLIDLVKKNEHLATLVEELRKDAPHTIIQTSHAIADVREADYIISATSAPEALIRDDDVKPGSVIIDDAQPSDIHASVFKREDVLVLEAGAVHTPGISVNFDLDLKNKYDNFSCLAEALILAVDEHPNHFVLGSVLPEQIDLIAERGRKLGFTIAAYQNQYEIIQPERIAAVAAIKKQQQA